MNSNFPFIAQIQIKDKNELIILHSMLNSISRKHVIDEIQSSYNTYIRKHKHNIDENIVADFFDKLYRDVLEIIRKQSKEENSVDSINATNNSNPNHFSEIYTKKIPKYGKMYIKILGFKYINRAQEVLPEYLKTYPHFYKVNNFSADKEDSIVLVLSKISKIYFSVGDEIEIGTFRYYVEKMGQAGKKLGELRKNRNNKVSVTDNSDLPATSNYVKYII